MTEAGTTQQSSCSDIELRVMPPNRRRHQPITNNTIIYRPVHTQGFRVRCQCTSNNRITPTWSFSDGSIITACNNGQNFEICSNISKKSPQILSFSLLSEEFIGFYKCHTKTITKLFKLFAFGQCCQICMLLLNLLMYSCRSSCHSTTYQTKAIASRRHRFTL